MGNKSSKKLPSPFSNSLRKDLNENNPQNNSELVLTPSTSIDDVTDKNTSQTDVTISISLVNHQKNFVVLYIIVSQVCLSSCFRLDLSNITTPFLVHQQAETAEEEKYPRDVIIALLLKKYALTYKMWPIIHMPTTDETSYDKFVDQAHYLHQKFIYSPHVNLIATVEIQTENTIPNLKLGFDGYSDEIFQLVPERFMLQSSMDIPSKKKVRSVFKDNKHIMLWSTSEGEKYLFREIDDDIRYFFEKVFGHALTHKIK